MAPPTQDALLQDQLLRKLFGLPDNPEAPREPFHAVGSGVVYDADLGYVITSSHVVADADRILITLNDRRQFDARLVGADPETDIAVLKVEARGLTALAVAEPRSLQVGDYVVAIGDAFGVGQTATFGIVSALGRSALGLERFEDFIQTDASINPGNSGGALVDAGGRLVGINTAIISRGGGNVGVGFAIPVDMVQSIAAQLIATGTVARGGPRRRDPGADARACGGRWARPGRRGRWWRRSGPAPPRPRPASRKATSSRPSTASPSRGRPASQRDRPQAAPERSCA